jgi:putative SOS response-associated peptidase YedK
VLREFDLKERLEFEPRYNIPPTGQLLALARRGGTLRPTWLKWCLIPSWTRDPKTGAKLVNARSETLLEKPAFREAYKARRCLLVIDGFYEWVLWQKRKLPIYFRLKSGRPIAVAGF